MTRRRLEEIMDDVVQINGKRPAIARTTSANYLSSFTTSLPSCRQSQKGWDVLVQSTY